MHQEDWHARLKGWRDTEIARPASDAERTEAAIEAERDLLETMRQLRSSVEFDPGAGTAESRLDAPGLAKDLDGMLAERLATHGGRALTPPRIAEDPGRDPERLAYTLEASAGAYELEAAAIRTTATMLRVRALAARLLEEAR